MTPVVKMDERDRVGQAQPSVGPGPYPPGEREMPAAPRPLTHAERQGMAMAWLALGLGMFLLLGGLALGAAIVFDAGFGGWLVTLALMGLVVVAAIAAVNQFVMRPPR